MKTEVGKEYVQLGFFLPSTPYYALYEEKREELDKKFEGFFRREIVPLIPIHLVRRLYSGRNIGRPANNMVAEVAARIYIKCQGLNEDYFLDHIHFDIAMQYAIKTESSNVQPFSNNTFKRQRERIRNYNKEYDADIWDEITSYIDNEIANKICRSRWYSRDFQYAYRIDSMMIDAHGASMTRLEIIYSTISLAVGVLHDLGVEEYIPSQLVHYLDEKDHNRLLYYKGTNAEIETECKKRGIVTDASKRVEITTNKNTEIDKRKRRLELIAELRIAIIIQEISTAIDMLESIGLKEIQEYSNLVRLLNDQTKLDSNGKRIPKDKKEIKGSSIQNPYEPDMTYRSKNHYGFHGYSAFFAEQYTPEGDGVIVARYLEQNVYSDQSFAKRFYSKFPDNNRKTIAVCADALFSSHELHGLADQKGISIFCASTTGKPPNVILADFTFNDNRTEIIACPLNHKPVSSQFEDKNGGQIKITFDSKCCQECEYTEACHARTTKRGNPHSKAEINLNQVIAATNIKMLHDPVFRAMVNKRNAVEGIPSVMRRKYDIDDIPYFGMQYAAETFYTDCTAYNAIKFFYWYRRNSER